jgi:hypothetical protein
MHNVADFDSTLLRSARNAVTFTDMRQFASTLESRPILQLLEELPEIAKLSNAKFDVATSVLRKRFRNELPIDQLQLRTIGLEIADRTPDAAVAERIRTIFDV